MARSEKARYHDGSMHRLGCLLLFLFPFISQAEDARLARIRVLLAPMRAAPVGLPARGATPELTIVKHELRDWVESRLSEFKGDTKELEDRLNEDLRRAGLFCGMGSSSNNDSPCPDQGPLGFLEEIRLKQNWPSLIVQTSVRIQVCGVDESAYAYRLVDDHWQRFWESEQNDYREEKYAPQSLRAVLVSPERSDRHADKSDHLVLTLGTEPWCTSNWHPIYIRAWRTKASYSEPKLLVDEKEEFAFLAQPLRGSIGENDMLVEYAIESMDGGVHNRREIRHYLVDQDKAVRVDPIVLSPRDFVDEWLHHPISEMSVWTEQSALPTLEKWHGQWKGPILSGEFIYPTLHCEDQPDLWQVGITPNGESGKEDAPPVYFLIRWRPPYHFTMVDAGDRPWPNCTEEDRDADENHTLFLADWH